VFNIYLIYLVSTGSTFTKIASQKANMQTMLIILCLFSFLSLLVVSKPISFSKINNTSHLIIVVTTTTTTTTTKPLNPKQVGVG